MPRCLLHKYTASHRRHAVGAQHAAPLLPGGSILVQDLRNGHLGGLSRWRASENMAGGRASRRRGMTALPIGVSLRRRYCSPVPLVGRVTYTSWPRTVTGNVGTAGALGRFTQTPSCRLKRQPCHIHVTVPLYRGPLLSGAAACGQTSSMA